MLEFFDIFFNDFLKRLQVFRVFLKVFAFWGVLAKVLGSFRWFLLLLMVCLAEIVDVFGDFDDLWRVLSRVGGCLTSRYGGF